MGDSYKKTLRDNLREKASNLTEKALLDAELTGYGFIAISRVRGSQAYHVRHLSWSEVKEALHEIGAMGPLGGFDK
jgi:hypothetical protein